MSDPRPEVPTAARAIARHERGWWRERRVLEFDLRYADGRVERVESIEQALRGLHPTDLSVTRTSAVSACPETGTGEWVPFG